MRRRLERARDLLRPTALPIADIAAQIGYQDPGQFAAVFRKVVGTRPSQYRRER